MKAVSISRVVLASSLAFVALSGQAQNQPQELTVFQGVEGGGRAQFGQMPTAPAAPAESTQNLVLKGIYRFGDTYHVSLQDSESGGNYRASWQQGQSGTVAVAGGYEIESVDSRTVNVNLPNGVNCEQNPLAGSNCVGRAQAALSFAVTEPVRTTRNFTRSRNDFRGGNNDTRNPFSMDEDDARQIREEIESRIRRGEDRGEVMRDVLGDRMREAFGGDNNGGGRGGRGGFGGFPD